MRRIISLSLILASVALMGASCSLGVGSNPQTVDETTTGGIYRTLDQGLTWKQLGVIATASSQKVNLFGMDTSVLVADPSDNQAMYMGSFADGIFYSYDGGNSWQVMRALGQKTIIDIAIDPKDKCTLYAATVGRIFKSVDCGRGWREIYSDNDKTQLIYSIVIDHFNPKIIYMSNARGDVIKSDDAGETWRTLINFKNEVTKLVMDPKNSRLLFACTSAKGVQKSLDGGATWEDLTPKLKDVKADRGFRDMIASPSQPGLYFLAVDYGLVKTANYGNDWTEIKLIIPERRSFIKSIAVNPLDPAKIYYDTTTTFYSTIDGGVNWASTKLPSPRLGSQILVSTAKGNPIFLGVRTK